MRTDTGLVFESLFPELPRLPELLRDNKVHEAIEAMGPAVPTSRSLVGKVRDAIKDSVRSRRQVDHERCQQAARSLLEAEQSFFEDGRVHNAPDRFQAIVGDSLAVDACLRGVQVWALAQKAWALYSQRQVATAISTMTSASQWAVPPGMAALIKSRLCMMKAANPASGDGRQECAQALAAAEGQPMDTDTQVTIFVTVATVRRDRRLLEKADAVCRGVGANGCAWQHEIHQHRAQLS